jgi:hypothetical protein
VSNMRYSDVARTAKRSVAQSAGSHQRSLTVSPGERRDAWSRTAKPMHEGEIHQSYLAAARFYRLEIVSHTSGGFHEIDIACR